MRDSHAGPQPWWPGSKIPTGISQEEFLPLFNCKLYIWFDLLLLFAENIFKQLLNAPEATALVGQHVCSIASWPPTSTHPPSPTPSMRCHGEVPGAFPPLGCWWQWQTPPPKRWKNQGQEGDNATIFFRKKTIGVACLYLGIPKKTTHSIGSLRPFAGLPGRSVQKYAKTWNHHECGSWCKPLNGPYSKWTSLAWWQTCP